MTKEAARFEIVGRLQSVESGGVADEEATL
jgi:hypothetical protein